ncbi:hypothetical protein CCACVL1_22566, partial [Corchorus capsularis]
ISAECNARKEIFSKEESAGGSSGLGEQGPEDITNAYQGKNFTLPTERPLVTTLEKSNTEIQHLKEGSPFRLLQDYASDDSLEKDVKIHVQNTSVLFGDNLSRDAGSNLENASSLYKPEKGFGPISLSSVPCAIGSSEVVEGTFTTPITNGNEHIGNKHIQQVSINNASSMEVLHKEIVMFSKDHTQEKENETLGSAQHKVDKFGRLVKDGGSDSDSDDSCHIRRHGNRSRGRSFSPPNRRRIRSPLKRREKRSRSRSWSPRNRRSRSRSPRNRRSRSRSPRNRRSRSRSPRNRRSRSRSPRNRRSRSRSPRNRRSRSRSPRNRRSRSRSPRNRRSRSRSPSFRRAGAFRSENKRQLKGKMPECFDFRRGRCYRGASCRYLHHGSNKSDESRGQRNKQQNLEFPQSSKTNDSLEIKPIPDKEAVQEHGGAGGTEVKLNNNSVGTRDMNIDQERQYSVGGGGSQSTQYHIVKSENSRDISASVFETHSVETKQEGSLNSCDIASQKIHSSFKSSFDQKSLSSPLDPVCQSAGCLPQRSDNLSDSSPYKTSTSSPNRLLESNAHKNTKDLHNHPSHIPSHSLPSSQGLDILHTKQHQTASSRESFPSYMLPNQPSYFALQQNPSLSSLPPPPSLAPQDSMVNAGTVTTGVSSHFQQSYMPLRNDFGSQIVPRPYPAELPAQSQSNGFQHQPYLPIQEANQPMHASLPMYTQPIQQCGAPSMLREDGFMQPSFAQGNTHPQTMPFSHQMLVGNKTQPFPSESLQPGGFRHSSSCMDSYSQQQHPPHSLHHPMVDSNYALTGMVNSSINDTPDIKETKPHHVDIGGSTSSIFPNPHAPTPDQPINSKCSSDVLRQDIDTTYNKTPFSSTHIPVDERGIISQQAMSSPNSARAIGQNFPISTGDQYDPLVDSIEPSSRLSRKFDHIKKMEVTGDSDMLLGFSGSNKPLDMEENNKTEDGGAIASAASADNEEIGETADAEVGAVEYGSPHNPVEINMPTGEIEIDQIKSPGNSKKDKDSRSLKLFKVALADFVKEVLKPSWQKGNMSKEAFKTIVKKTVDKVAGAMKSHQIPKSRGKVDRYIESSQLKLTKLVMGYVDKYVNV